MKLLRLKPGHGEIVVAEGDVEVAEEEQALIEAFRRELDAGMWAAVPAERRDGRRTAELVKSFADVPRDAERVIFFPRAAGGAPQPGLPQPRMPQPGMPQPGIPQPGMPQPGIPQPGMPQPGSRSGAS
jgi:hypothetical protein